MKNALEKADLLSESEEGDLGSEHLARRENCAKCATKEEEECELGFYQFAAMRDLRLFLLFFFFSSSFASFPCFVCFPLSLSLLLFLLQEKLTRGLFTAFQSFNGFLMLWTRVCVRQNKKFTQTNTCLLFAPADQSGTGTSGEPLSGTAEWLFVVPPKLAPVMVRRNLLFGGNCMTDKFSMGNRLITALAIDETWGERR